VGYGYPEDDLVERVLGFVNHRLVIVEEQEERHLVQNKFLTQTQVQVVGLNVAEHCETREATVHHEGEHKELGRDLTEVLQSSLRQLPLLFFYLRKLYLFFVFLFDVFAPDFRLDSVHLVRWLHPHMLVHGLLGLLRVFEVAALEAETDEPDVVDDDEEDAQEENSPPNFSDLLRNPLRRPKVGNLDAHVKQVDEAAGEAECVHHCLFARVRVQLVVVRFLHRQSLLLELYLVCFEERVGLVPLRVDIATLSQRFYTHFGLRTLRLLLAEGGHLLLELGGSLADFFVRS